MSKFFIFIVSFIFFQSCVNDVPESADCIDNINTEDLIGIWELEDNNESYLVLTFENDSLLYVEHEAFRSPYFYYIDSNQIIITVANKSKILYRNEIVCLKDSILKLSSIIDLVEERTYVRVMDGEIQRLSYEKIY